MDRPYLILLGGHQLTTAAAFAVVRARKMHNKKRDEKSSVAVQTDW
jgi:hypothetical protein